MVKICQNCGNKNYNDSRKCINCDGDISQVPISKDPKFNDNRQRYNPRDESIFSNPGRPFTIMGFFLALAFLISSFIVPMNILTITFFYILSCLVIVMGFLAMKKDDSLGIIPLIIGLLITIAMTCALIFALKMIS